jgi:hypothetical protein
MRIVKCHFVMSACVISDALRNKIVAGNGRRVLLVGRVLGHVHSKVYRFTCEWICSCDLIHFADISRRANEIHESASVSTQLDASWAPEVDGLLQEVTHLQHTVTEATALLPAYDARRTQEVCQVLEAPTHYINTSTGDQSP